MQQLTPSGALLLELSTPSMYFSWGGNQNSPCLHQTCRRELILPPCSILTSTLRISVFLSCKARNIKEPLHSQWKMEIHGRVAKVNLLWSPAAAHIHQIQLSKRESFHCCHVFSSSSKGTWSTWGSVKSVLWHITRMLQLLTVMSISINQVQIRSSQKKIEWICQNAEFFSQANDFFPW